MNHAALTTVDSRSVAGPSPVRPPAGRWSWLGDICFVSFGKDPLTAKLRRAQVASLSGMLPASNAVALFNALLMVLALRQTVPAHDLFAWFGGMVVLVGGRLYHVVGRGRSSANPVSVYMLVLISAAMWSTPPLLWHDFGTPEQRLLVFLVTAGMMCGGCVTLSSMPLACWTFVVVLGTVMVSLDIHIGQPILAIMTVGFTMTLCWIGLRQGMQFIDHQRDRIELSEQAELVKLMREFEASGSGWLWEADSELRITYMTSDNNRISLARVRQQIGLPLQAIIDADGRIAQVSEGVQQLFKQLELRTAFRDIAVPTSGGRWWSLSGKPVFDHHGSLVGWRGLGSDITDARVHGQDAMQAARRDPLTGLANRLLVREAIEEALLWADGNGCAVLLVDLDRFKLVNDTLGHAVGDMLLKEVAGRLQRSARGDAVVGRLGGDEFAVVLPGSLPRERLAAMADRLIANLSAAYLIGGVDLHIGATVGIAIAPGDAGSQEELTTRADLALYRAKEEGRGTYRFYATWMSELAQANRELESDLRAAVRSGSLSLAYQPIVSADERQVTGYEALLRWHHATLGDVPPDRFVPIIEDAGLMNQVGSWVIREACAEAATWPEPHRIAVNVSATQISGASLAATVLGALAETGLAADRLELEVTESIFLADDEGTLGALARLRNLGVRLVVDDFGKGYSSFGYLARAQFSQIKIDQSFVRGAAAGERESVAIVHGILALARGLDVETTAEGIETEAEAEVMRILGCSKLQGFLFGRPAASGAARQYWRRPLPVERRKAS